jgi:thioredoxin reductase/ferredoxin
LALPETLNVTIEFSPKLGVRELPQLDRDHQSNVPGLYIVGDLADAPIIKVALHQGFSVAHHIADGLGTSAEDEATLDVLVIGAGPAGIGAALALQERGLRYVIIEREAPFATIQNFPKAKLIFSEPKEMVSPGNFWFEDATKEELVERWRAALDEEQLRIQQPEEVVDVRRSGDIFEIHTRVGAAGLATQELPGAASAPDSPNRYRARRVILAAGKRGQVRTLGVPGEDAPHVHHALKDPAEHAGRPVVVVGGGDSAVEAAASLAEAGAEVVLSYRGDSFHRTKARNRERIEALAEDGQLELALRSRPVRISETGVELAFDDPDAVPPASTSATGEVPARDVFVFIGNKLPLAFLRRIGVRMQGDMHLGRALWIVGFALLTWCFYILKGGTVWDEARQLHVAKKAFFPFGPDQLLGAVPDLLRVDLGFRTVDGAFWGTAVYSLLIMIFGIRGYLRYPRKDQKQRYVSLVSFQLLFLFGIPELLAPAVIAAGGEGGLFWTIFGGDRGWKFYALSVPWPLNIWALIDAPSWSATGSTTTVLLWLALAAGVSFVAIPLYVRRHGERFCSWMCGCGGLAETLGDFWRHLAPRGRTARQAEWFGRLVYLLAIPTTLLIVSDAWGFLRAGALTDARAFAEHWYMLMVDFWLASVLGVALYPYLGNRVWCRFFCPLRAYMEVLAKRFSRIQIRSNDKCIGCGECTRYCQMGIDVQRFAQTRTDLHNGNSACIQCGICIQVCPMEVLSLDRGREVQLRIDSGPALAPPKASWES